MLSPDSTHKHSSVNELRWLLLNNEIVPPDLLERLRIDGFNPPTVIAKLRNEVSKGTECERVS